MRVSLIAEPELEFGLGQHIDIRFGIMTYGPLDYATAVAPRAIRVGIVGTTETVEGVEAWFERCRSEISAKESNQPYLFPRFPGFNPDVAFRSTLITEARLRRTISSRVFERLAKASDPSWVAREAVDVFYAELEHLADEGRADVVVCAVPTDLLNATERERPKDEEDDEDDSGNRSGGKVDFHDLLKARAMALRMPIQIIIPSTYDPSKRCQQKRRTTRMRRLQDDATRAWNIHTALYYKANGIPWRLLRDPSDLMTCHIGISFYKMPDGTELRTSVAQVFNERGQGIIVRGGKAQRSNKDKQVHLTEEGADALLAHALTTYRSEHGTLPARVVLHKSSPYNDEELAGFTAAIERRNIEGFDCVSIKHSFTRLYRSASYPPLRGTLFNLDERHHILYTRGSVDFFATYPGLYVPRPLELRCDQTEQTPMFLAQEILALTKMNWNSTQFDNGDPITLRASGQVGKILKYVGEDERVEPRYSFYM